MGLGQKLKELRKIQNMTLVQLSEKSGVQVATLSRIENERMTGTLESHMAIATALSVDVTQLYSGLVEPAGRIEVQDNKTQKDVFVHSDKASYEILTTNVLKKKMMPTLLKIESGGQTNTEENALGTEKFVYVLEGSIEVTIGSDAYALSKGNSLYFDASFKHFIKNKIKSTAKILVTASPSTI